MNPAQKNILILVSIFCLLFLIFNNLKLSFVTHDDFNFFIDGNIEFISKYYDTIGRPIAALLMRSTEHLNLFGFSELFQKVRLPLLLVLSVSIYFSIKFFSYFNLSYYFSIPFSIALFLLPQVGAQLIWLQTAPGLISTALGLAAILPFLQWCNKGKHTQFLWTILLLCGSLLTYPSSTFIFPLFIGIAIFLELRRTETLNKKFIFGFFVFFSLFVIYFLFVKYGLQPFLRANDLYVDPFNQSNVFKLEFSPLEKFNYVVFYLLPRLLAFHTLTPTLDGKLVFSTWNILVLATSISVFLLSLALVIKKMDGRNFNRVSLVCLLVLIATFLVTIIPSTLPQAPVPIYRILLPPTGLLLFVVMYAAFFATNLSAAGKAFFAILFIATPSIITQSNINKHTQALNLEYEYVRAKIMAHMNENGEIPEKIFFVYEPWTERELSYNAERTAEEYNWIAQSEFIFGAVNSVFGELYEKKIQITHRPCPRFKFQSCINFIEKNENAKIIRTFHGTTMPEQIGKNDVLINTRDLMPLREHLKDSFFSGVNAISTSSATQRATGDRFYTRVLSYDDRFKPYAIEIGGSLAFVSTDVFFGGHGLDRAFDKSTSPDSFWESFWTSGGPANLYVTTSEQIDELVIQSGQLTTKGPSRIECFIKYKSENNYVGCGTANVKPGEQAKLTLLNNRYDAMQKKYKFVLHPMVPGQMRLYEIAFKLR